ncbi:MAG TPA: DUF3667 domain-containing protein [Rhodanobacter sp.]|jgi:hypothetical protein|nr:DUF3667 domain-containing protein [Rhodanobacter sp.]
MASMPPALPPTPLPACANCGAPLHGKFCYECGQPVEGLVRHFGSVLGDVADSLLNIDARIAKTLLPLYFRPGQLTQDYLEGKRARYVTPFRLVFFLAIIAFFAIQLSLRTESARFVQIDPSPTGKSVSATGQADTPDTHFAGGDIKVNGKVIWNRETKPLRMRWLPPFANEWLNDSIENARGNLHHMNSGNSAEAKSAALRLMGGMFAVAPQVLFVLLPVFALLLKIFYIFKRRLYMEHLIVSMHSHAFIMLSLLVMVALELLRSSLVPHAAWLGVPLGAFRAAAWIWLLAYLLIMQKRIYRQGWPMTVLKYGCIGFCYSVLVVFGLVFALLISLGSS